MDLASINATMTDVKKLIHGQKDKYVSTEQLDQIVNQLPLIEQIIFNDMLGAIDGLIDSKDVNELANGPVVTPLSANYLFDEDSVKSQHYEPYTWPELIEQLYNVSLNVEAE